MYQTLLTSLENNIFTITINRADKMNALNKDVITELDAAVDEVYKNAEIRSAIITGAGTKAFVAGADISEFVYAVVGVRIKDSFENEVFHQQPEVF